MDYLPVIFDKVKEHIWMDFGTISFQDSSHFWVCAYQLTSTTQSASF